MNAETDPSAEPEKTTPPEDTPKTQGENPPADELPEEFELTPEIVEEDAQRNDFMLRLAVVLLAVFFGCTQIRETEVLLHIKTGDYLMENGILPPRTDVFSHTAQDLPWVNLPWLFDLVAACVFAVGGSIGLTIAKAVVAGIAFYFLMKAIQSDVPTWWGSICLGLALIVCSGHLDFGPVLITLTGFALMFWLFSRWQQSGGESSLWPLLIVFWVWANCDPRAFLGLYAFMLLGVGELLSQLLGRSVIGEGPSRTRFWIFLPASLIVFLVHPFGWNTLLSPLSLYAVEYPALQQLLAGITGGSIDTYLPLTRPEFWQNLSLPVISALVLAITVPVTFVMNWRRVAIAHIALFLGMIPVALANSHELPVVSVVFAVLAAWNAQEWYRENFRQTYSVAMSERVFSVGGRAVTAFAIFGLAFLGMTGRLLGPQSQSLGFGFEKALTTQISEFEKDLEESQPPGNIANFSLSQGNLLIWLDHKPFIDRRLAVFAQGKDESIFEDYRTLFRAWGEVRPEKEEGETAFRERVQKIQAESQAAIKDYKVQHLLIPLGPRKAHYGTLTALNYDPQWGLTHLSSMGGWFSRIIPNEPETRDYINDHLVSFRKQAYQTQSDDFEGRELLAKSPTWTDEVFQSRKRQSEPSHALMARHLYQMLSAQAFTIQVLEALVQQNRVAELDGYLQGRTAMGHLAIGHAQRALEEDPNSVLALTALGDTLINMSGFEEQLTALTGGQIPITGERRYIQTVIAYQQALVADPTKKSLHITLYQLYSRFQRYDLALRELKLYLAGAEIPSEDKKLEREGYERLLREKKKLEVKVEEVQTRLDQLSGPDVPRMALAQTAKSEGCVLKAIELLEPSGDAPQIPDLTQMYVRSVFLLEAGDIEKAYPGLQQAAASLEDEKKKRGFAGQPNVRDAVAMAAIGIGDYQTAIEQWTTLAEEVEELAMWKVLGTLPLANRPVEPEMLFQRVSDMWAINNWMSGEAITRAMPEKAGQALLNAALCHLELGQPNKAEPILKQILENYPSSSAVRLASFYHRAIQGDVAKPTVSPDEIPIEGDMFVPEPAIAEKPTPGE